VRCPACGAHNPAEAAWCGQCYVQLGGAPQDAEAPRPDASRSELARPDPPRPVAAPTARHTPEQATATAPVDDRPVRTRDGEVEWRCARCGGWSPLVAPSCPVCGTARRGFEVASSPARTTVDLPRPVLVVATAVVPGLGHLLAGRTGTGTARSVLALLWGIAGLALVTGAAPVAGAILLAGWATLVVASLLDLPVPGDVRSRELLTARRLAVLVATVTGLLLLSLAFVAPELGR
jgi:hypothetical protein